MKILIKDGKYEKVPNDFIAEQKVKLYGYQYAKKQDWKSNVRDVKVVEESPEIKRTISEKYKTKEKRAKNHKKIYDKQKHQ